MGFVQGWIAAKSEKISDVLEFLKLRPNGGRCEFADGDWSYANLRNGWHVVVTNERKGPFFTEMPDEMKKLSLLSDLIVGAVEEHVNYGACEFWQSGKNIWKIGYIGCEEPRTVNAEGELPDCFKKIKEECETLQDGDPNTDYLIEIPFRVCQKICGYVHDQDIDGIGEDAFYELERVS